MKLTEAQLNTIQLEQLEKLIATAGSVNHLAKMLEIHYMTVQGWHKRERISKGGAELVAEHPTLGKKFRAIDLRPDIFI
jgi:hypothetical protein